MRILIALIIMALLMTVGWFGAAQIIRVTGSVRHDDPPKRIDPRAYHCDPDSGLACPGTPR